MKFFGNFVGANESLIKPSIISKITKCSACNHTISKCGWVIKSTQKKSSFDSMGKKISVEWAFLSVRTKEKVINNPPWKTSKSTNGDKSGESVCFFTKLINLIFTFFQELIWCWRIRFIFHRIECDNKEQK